MLIGFVVDDTGAASDRDADALGKLGCERILSPTQGVFAVDDVIPYLRKGDVLAVARLAGIAAAKKTGDLILLCHPLPLDSATVDFEYLDEETIKVEARVSCTGRTGVEMEALTAVSVAALTVYDMTKALDKAIEIQDVYLVSKTGGKSGDFRR